MTRSFSIRNITRHQHHSAIWAAHENGFLRGIGQGLLNAMMIRYLLMGLCRAQPDTLAWEGTVIAWAIAAPQFAGFFRFFTAILVDLFDSRKWFCIGGLLFAPVFVGSIPFLCYEKHVTGWRG